MIPFLCLLACTGMLYRMRDRFGDCMQTPEAKECSICFELIGHDSQSCKFDKRHVFHRSCWKEWMKERSSCPICRRSQGMFIDIHGNEDESLREHFAWLFQL